MNELGSPDKIQSCGDTTAPSAQGLRQETKRACELLKHVRNGGNTTVNSLAKVWTGPVAVVQGSKMQPP